MDSVPSAPERPLRPLLWAAAALVAAPLLVEYAGPPLLALVGAAFGAAIVFAYAPRAPCGWVLLLLLASVRARIEHSADEPDARAGTLAIRSEHGDVQRCEFVANGARVRLPRGSVNDGERVRLVGTGTESLWPAGPEPGPEARSGRTGPTQEFRHDEIVRLRTHSWSAWDPLAAPLARLRAAVDRRLLELDDPSSRGFARAFVLGDTSSLPEGVPDLFVRTGTYHVLAISGLQVVLFLVLFAAPIARVLAALAGRLPRLRPREELVRLPAFLVVAGVGGAGAPVVRSALACALAPFSRCVPAPLPLRALADGRRAFLGRIGDPLSLWSLALVCECLRDARAPFGLSVQLSYAATLGLVLGTRPILHALLPRLERDASGLPVPLATIARRRCARVIASALAASAAAVLVTTPFTWPRFGEWSAAGLVATPLTVPPMAVLLLAAWTWIVCPPLVPDFVFETASRTLLALLEVCDLLPGSPMPLPPRPAWLVAGCAICVVVAWCARERSTARNALRVAAVAAGILLLPWSARPARTELVALDVGHGSALLLRTWDAGTWIFDAGSRDRPDVAREALGPALAAWESGALSIVVSHLDEDHHGALAWVVERYPTRLWAGALPAHLAERLPHATPRVDLGPGVVELARGPTRIRLWRGLAVPGNEGSRMLEVEAHAERALLFGDAEAEGLSALLGAHALPRAAELCLFPHHGSETDRLGALLDRTRPGRVWCSNSGRPPVADELDRRAIAWESTGVQGVLVWRPGAARRGEKRATAGAGTFPARALAVEPSTDAGRADALFPTRHDSGASALHGAAFRTRLHVPLREVPPP